MKKINEIESKENFKKMEDTSYYIINQLKELNDEVLEELQGLEEAGFYCTITEEVYKTIPMEERYYQKYYPTYAMSVLLLKYYLSGHKEIYNQMTDTIKASLYMKYVGHGYDDHTVRLRYLTALYKAGVKEIFENEEGIARNLGLLVYQYRKMLHDGNVVQGFGSIEKEIVELLKAVDNDVLFVYGTLMEGNINSHYLDECPIYGEGVIEGYQLVQLRGYPGMIRTGEGTVAGEVYAITPQVKQQLDILEGSQYRYSSDIIYLGEAAYYAHFYEFIPRINARYPAAYTLNDKWQDVSDYVWYACYGSNILEERFNKYIERTSSKQKPIASKAIILPYELYFGKKSRRWNNQGVAFLDYQTSSTSFCWMYLITKQQFEEIKEMEGPVWYSEELYIGRDDAGIDIRTMTSPYRYEEVKPFKEYLEVIGAGIREKYNMTDEKINEYLNTEGCNYSMEHVSKILSDK